MKQSEIPPFPSPNTLCLYIEPAVRVLVKNISKQRVLRGWTRTKHGEHGVENEELQFVERR